MKKFNLHTHSKYSLDATLDINEILNKGFKKSITYLSVTDHNTCDAYLDLDKNKINGNGTLIYGMEADAVINNVTYDILCYGFNFEPVSMWSKEQYSDVATRQTKIYKKLEELCNSKNITLDTSTPFNPETEFAHAAVFRMLNSIPESKAFLDKYNIASISDLYRKSTMDSTFPLYIDMTIVWPTIEILEEIIHNNGGKIFLAHPYRYAKEGNIDDLLKACTPYIDGIEIYNEPKNFEEVKHLYDFAKNYNLLVSQGSDFHGNKKHNKIDVDYLTEEMQNDIGNWINKINGKIDF